MKSDTISAIDNFIIAFLQYKNILKLFHFNTPIGFHHLKVDDLEGKISDSFDLFCEAYQGLLRDRINFNKPVNIEIITPSKDIMILYTEDLKKILKEISRLIKGTIYIELDNIIDVIHNELSRFLYLLTFN